MRIFLSNFRCNYNVEGNSPRNKFQLAGSFSYGCNRFKVEIGSRLLLKKIKSYSLKLSNRINLSRSCGLVLTVDVFVLSRAAFKMYF